MNIPNTINKCVNSTHNDRELSLLRLVVHRRSVAINPPKDVYRMDFMNRMMFCIGLAYNQEPLSMITKAIYQDDDEHESTFSQFVLMDEEVQEDLLPRLEEEMNGHLREIRESRRHLYLLAQVLTLRRN